MFKNLAFPTTLLTAVLKFKGPSLLFCLPYAGAQISSLIFSILPAHLGEREMATEWPSQGKQSLLTMKTQCTPNESLRSFYDGNLGES